METKPAIKNRLKSFLWRTGGMAFVAMCAYISQVGDIFEVDFRTLANIGITVIIGLAAGEVTKYLNSER